MYVENFFHLDHEFKKYLKEMPNSFGYGVFSEVVYYDHYSRVVNGKKEQWSDTVIRVIEGIFSIRKDWYIKARVAWCEESMQYLAFEMAKSFHLLKWSPAGRGVWAMGTELIYRRGSMPLYNCAYTRAEGIDDLAWIMNGLMNGVGVSAGVTRNKPVIQQGTGHTIFRVPDSREGWVQSLEVLLQHYLKGGPLPVFDYSGIRKPGEPLKTFGGTSSGAGPLIKLHERVHDIMCAGRSTWMCDLVNVIGCCVVAGNIRRSAEMLIGGEDVIGLKDLSYRDEWSWMSNNTVRLIDNFDLIDIIDFIGSHESPGFMNMINLPKGRLRHGDRCVEDVAEGLNPCGEIPLESREVCNVAETYPTRCLDTEDWLNACKFACFYTCTVSLLPTQDVSTNQVVARNRRIGVGIVDYNAWRGLLGQAGVTDALRAGYKCVRHFNKIFNNAAGIPESIRVTTVKPGGTMPKLAGCIGGIGYNPSSYIIRRKRVQEDSALHGVLLDAGVPCEKDYYSDNTIVAEFPVYTGEVYAPDLWEQAMNLVTVQREWADNAVSNTLTFDDSDNVGVVLGNIMPMIKSVSVMRRDTGVYEQMPEESITAEEYFKRLGAIGELRLGSDSDVDATESDKFCSGGKCEVAQ